MKTLRISKISLSLLDAQGLASSRSPRVGELRAILDPERVSSLPGILSAHAQRAEAINQDRELSAEGKRARIAAQAGATVGNLATLAKKVIKAEAAHRAETEGAVQIPKADAADTLVDLALAAHLRESNPIKTKLLNGSERLRLAAARMPAELTGLSPEVHAAVRGSLIAPELAVSLGEEAAALEAARRVVQGAIDELASEAQLPPRELVDLFGAGWRLPGVAPTMAERLNAETADAVDAAA